MSILMSGYQEFDNTDRRQGMIEKYKIVITFEDEEERTYIYDDEEEMGETLEFYYDLWTDKNTIGNIDKVIQSFISYNQDGSVYYDCNCCIRPGLNKILGIFMD